MSERNTQSPYTSAGFVLRSPIRLGFTAAIGLGVVYLIFSALRAGHNSFVLVALALFLAAGLDPAVHRVERIGLKRGPAVGLVFIASIGMLVAVGLAVIPSLASQTNTFAQNLPGYITELRHNRRIADLDRRFGVLQSIQNYVNESSNPSNVASRLLSVGTSIADSIFSLFTLAILTLYFLAYLRDISAFVYRITPQSRRERTTEIGDRVIEQIGRYVAGSLSLALLASVSTLAFLWACNVPDPLALAFGVLVLNIAPLIGPLLAVIGVSAVAFLHSIPAGIATVVFFVIYLIVQRIFLTPRLLHPTVRISPAAALVGILAGYSTLGFVGFLVSIPTVAVITLILREVVLPRQQAR